MFYNHDYLTSKKAGLRIVWLASTLGQASRKLTKREIAAVNVTETCENVAHPSEPLALRTSSHLMYGVVRVYTKQAEYWMADVQTHYTTVRKVTSAGTGFSKQLGGLVIVGTDTTAIDLPGKGRQSRDVISLPARFDYFASNAGIDFDWAINDTVGHSDPFMESLASVVGRRAGSHSNSLVHSGEFAVGLDSSSPMGGRYTLEPTQLRRLHIRSSATANMMPFDVERPLPDVMDGEGLDLGLEQVLDSTVLPALIDEQVEDVMAFWEEGYPQQSQFLQQSLSSPLRQRQRSSSLDLQAVQRRRKKTRFALSDSSIELSDEVVLESREDYVRIMAAKREEEAGRVMVKWGKKEAGRLLFGPGPDLVAAPALREQWSNSVSSCMALIESHTPAVDPMQPSAQARRNDGQLGDVRYDQQMYLDDIDMSQWEEEPSMSRGRGAATSSPAWGSEVGRGTQSSEKRDSLPWNQPFGAEGADTTLEADVTSLHSARSFSLETPTGLRRPSKRQSSVGAASIGGQEQETGEEMAMPPSNPLNGQDIAEKEVLSFLAYAGRVRSQLPTDQPLFFSDLAPMAASTPYIAARAFDHTLVLATAKYFAVHQPLAYGEIKIEIVAA